MFCFKDADWFATFQPERVAQRPRREHDRGGVEELAPWSLISVWRRTLVATYGCLVSPAPPPPRLALLEEVDELEYFLRWRANPRVVAPRMSDKVALLRASDSWSVGCAPIVQLLMNCVSVLPALVEAAVVASPLLTCVFVNMTTCYVEPKFGVDRNGRYMHPFNARFAVWMPNSARCRWCRVLRSSTHGMEVKDKWHATRYIRANDRSITIKITGGHSWRFLYCFARKPCSGTCVNILHNSSSGRVHTKLG